MTDPTCSSCEGKGWYYVGPKRTKGCECTYGILTAVSPVLLKKLSSESITGARQKRVRIRPSEWMERQKKVRIKPVESVERPEPEKRKKRERCKNGEGFQLLHGDEHDRLLEFGDAVRGLFGLKRLYTKEPPKAAISGGLQICDPDDGNYWHRVRPV